MRRNAFTLIELLVVIAIIALLLSILMPGLQKAKQHALRLLCRTNLHSYGIAANMYLLDNNEEFSNPWEGIYSQEAPYSFEGAPRECRWHNARVNLTENEEVQGPLWPYLEAEEINLCPVFEKMGKKFGPLHPFFSGGADPGHVSTTPIDPQFGYAQNAYLGYDHPRWGGITKSSQAKSPARTFFWAEENMWVMTPGKVDYTGERYSGEKISTAVLNDTALLARNSDDPANAIDQVDDAFGTFHSPPGGDYNNGTTNAVMLDGSIEAVSPYDSGTFKKAWPYLGGKVR